MAWVGTAWAALSSRVGQVVLALAGALALIAGVYFQGGKNATERARRRQAEAAQAQARERSDADQHAARSDDPAGELRRDWRRP
jgi:type II secretory pathway pseudopilin PulG